MRAWSEPTRSLSANTSLSTPTRNLRPFEVKSQVFANNEPDSRITLPEDFRLQHYLAETLQSLLHNLSTSFLHFQSSLPDNSSISFRDFFHATFPLVNVTHTTFSELNLTSPFSSPTLHNVTNVTFSGVEDVSYIIPWGSQRENLTNTSTESALGVERSAAEIVIISIVVSLLSVLTAGGNMLVIVAFKLDKNLQTVSNYFLLSLAVADLTIGIISMPLYTVYLLMGYWPLKALMCDIWLSLDYSLSNASVANLIIISFDRYLSVTRPITYRAKRTPRRAGTMIGCAWVISSVIWTPWIFAWPYIEGQRNVPETDCYIQFLKTNQYITIITAMFAFFIPVIIMSVLYFQIYRETQKRQKDLPKLQGMHKSKRIKDPQLRYHQPGNKSATSSDEEAYSSTSERGVNVAVSPEELEAAEPATFKSKLLSCLKIDRDSDYLEDSSTSDPPGSVPTSNIHSSSNLNALYGTRTNGDKYLPRQDSENSTNSQHCQPTKKPQTVRMNFSTSLIPLLPVDSPSPTSPMSGCRDLGFYTAASTPEQHLPSLSEGSLPRHSGLLTTSFSGPIAETINEDPLSDSEPSLNEEKDKHKSDSDDEDEDDENAMFRVLILLPGHAGELSLKPSIKIQPDEDLDMFSELNPGLVQRNDSDTDDEDASSRRLPERPTLPPPVRPPTGTPALARRAHSSDSNKVAMQAKIAAKAATKVRKAKLQTKSKIQSRRLERRQDQKAAKTLTAILLAFIVTWTPYNIFTVAEVFCEGCVNKTLYSIGEYPCYSISCSIPCILN